jgi:hypothetical protein
MADNDNKPSSGRPIVHVVPAILTGAAALIAALTTVYVNVRGDKAPHTTRTAPVVAAQTVAAVPRKLRLQVERIAVQDDGSIGTTDWRFAVAADGQPLFVFGADDLDDTGGRNVVLPGDAAGELELAAGKGTNISIDGWRGSRLRLTQGAPDVHGEGKLSAHGASASIRVAADPPGGGAFVFYFSATPTGDKR